MVSTADEQLTVLPEVIAVVFAIMSALEVPAEPSQIAVPPDCVESRNHASVPVLSALESSVMVAAVSVFDAAAPHAVAVIVSVNSSVCPETAVSGVAGCAVV